MLMWAELFNHLSAPASGFFTDGHPSEKVIKAHDVGEVSKITLDFFLTLEVDGEMGIFGGLTKALGVSREMDIEEFMSAAEAEEVDIMHKAADFYVKPIALQNDGDVKIVEDELKQRNLVLLNISPLARNPNKLKDSVNNLKAFVRSLDGDIARIDEDKILLTPANVKIVKRRK